MTASFTGSFRIQGIDCKIYGTFSSEGVFTLRYSESQNALTGNFTFEIDEDINSTECCTGRFNTLGFSIPGYDFIVEFNGPILVDLDGKPYEGSFSFNNHKCKGLFQRNHPFPMKMERSWREALSKELVQEYFLKLNDFLDSEGEDVCPELADIYKWTEACPIDKVKVVILGQDPYTSKSMAHGLAFSMKRGNQPSPSLKRIYKELELEGFLPPESLNHGYLWSWAEQGVLLLNTCLTVKENGDAGSHMGKGWETFTDAVIKHLNKTRNNLVFILWGNPAKEKAKFINEVSESNPFGHLILRGTHPSPGAMRNANVDFFSKHLLPRGEIAPTGAHQYFKECNDFLQSCNIPEINWASVLDEQYRTW